MLALVAAALAVSLAGLHRLGPPPMIRIDALWVRDHRTIVMAIVAALAAAVACSILPGGSARHRPALLNLWLLAVVVALLCYRARIVIVVEVLVEYVL